MKKVMLAALAAGILASGAVAAGEGFKICNYSDDVVPLSYHNTIITQSIVGRNLAPQFGNLEGIPLNVASQKGATSLKISWQSFLLQLDQKIINSSDPAAEITYLNLPLAKFQNVNTAEEASTKMVKDLLQSNKFLELLVDINSSNCAAHNDRGQRKGLESPWAVSRMINNSQQLKGVGINSYIIYLKNYLEKNINTKAEIEKFNKSKHVNSQH